MTHGWLGTTQDIFLTVDTTRRVSIYRHLKSSRVYRQLIIQVFKYFPSLFLVILLI